ncbi:hypothetical protein C2845_PM01G29380 [Panicum miliaceum]|uniref:Uncharacterized protein n=1 Tax=Panicum miliaceum TaxID=4540 RepID=A0A3L6TJ76_PANMI|nr:hypothetical protein C2845_PM01G29380 [Panicum miliaceum]
MSGGTKDGRLEGSAAGARRRRRLTLAPRPSTQVELKDGARVSKVWDASFADSDGSEESTQKANGKDWPVAQGDWLGAEHGRRRRVTEAYGRPSSDPLLGARKYGTGSRFWPLADEDSSDEDEVDEEIEILSLSEEDDVSIRRAKSLEDHAVDTCSANASHILGSTWPRAGSVGDSAARGA